MDRREFLTGMGAGLFSAVIAPELLAQIILQRYSSGRPDSPSSQGDIFRSGSSGMDSQPAARITAVGIVPTIGPILLGNPDRMVQFSRLTTLFQVSALSLHGHQRLTGSSGTLSGYAMRHVVAIIANLIYEPGIVCIDYTDVVAILKSAGRAQMGVAVAGGKRRGREAVNMAVSNLRNHEVILEDAKGALVVLHGSSSLTMDDYEDVSTMICGCLPQDANLVVGLQIDEQIGHNARVTVMVFG